VIQIILTLGEDPAFGVSCEAHKTGSNPNPNDVIIALGMMESAKMAMLAGRWGVMDEAKKRQLGFPQLGTDYKPIKKAKRSTAQRDLK
jgi:hypothetical protein